MTTPGTEPPDGRRAGGTQRQHRDPRRWWIAGLVGAFGVGLVIGLLIAPTDAGPVAEEEIAGVESAVDEPTTTRLEAAKQTCVSRRDSLFMEILDDGAGMSIDGVGAKKPLGADLDQIECILSELGARPRCGRGWVIREH